MRSAMAVAKKDKRIDMNIGDKTTIRIDARQFKNPESFTINKFQQKKKYLTDKRLK